MFSAQNTSASQSHPEPQQIYRLWQIFVDNINPLFKIVHIPTLQQRVLDASWNPSSAPQPLQATMFAIYALSVTSMSPEACQKAFNESRVALMTRYRTAAFQALVEADFLTTKDFEVVQAFVLFLFINPESELTATLTAAALKLCRSLGIHHAKPDPKVSFFEREMRIRVWWQLYGLEARTRALGSPDSRCPPSRSEFGDVRSPLNVNDADLHPDMTEAPIEHSRPTEMMCVLMKYEVFNWIRSTPAASLVFEHIAQSRARDKTMMEVESKAINEIEGIYYNKHLKDVDKRIPIHAQTFNMAKLVIARMRLVKEVGKYIDKISSSAVQWYGNWRFWGIGKIFNKARLAFPVKNAEIFPKSFGILDTSTQGGIVDLEAFCVGFVLASGQLKPSIHIKAERSRVVIGFKAVEMLKIDAYGSSKTPQLDVLMNPAVQLAKVMDNGPHPPLIKKEPLYPLE
ncbi:hypothetical protein K4K56_009325 [Colletotrichum sp. SAR 10_98]|nr:hypothetical protein K4K56_009325 [Colletotrichum sp. SAR 10_98]